MNDNTLLRLYVLKGTWLPKQELVLGGKYLCKARNFKYGVWTGTYFTYERTKWGRKFQDSEYHWDDGPPYGTVKPFLLIGRKDLVTGEEYE